MNQGTDCKSVSSHYFCRFWPTHLQILPENLKFKWQCSQYLELKKLSIELRVTLWGLTSYKENEQCYRLICPTMATSALGIINTYFLWIPQIHLFVAAWQLILLPTYFFKKRYETGRVQAISVSNAFTY